MPIYEYVCMSCESHFEELVRPDETPPCPDCGSEQAKRQFSAFAAHGLTKAPSSSAAACRRRLGWRLLWWELWLRRPLRA